MTKSTKLSLILLITAITVISGCTKNSPINQVQPGNNKPAEVVNDATSTEQNAQATSTKDWLTYRSQQYGFEVKYPKDLTMKDWAFKTPNWELLLNLGQNENISDGAVSFGIDKDIKNFDAEKVFWPIPREDIKIKEATVGVNNYKAHEVTVNFYSVDGDNNSLNYFIENANKLLIITYNKDKRAELSESTFKTILSTLKFIKPVIETTSIKDWLTYRSEQYGFEVKYPKDYITKKIENGINIKHPSYDLVPIYPAKGGSISIALTNIKIEDEIKSIEKSDPPLSRVISREEYVLDNVKGEEIVSTNAEGLDYYEIFIKYNNKEYLISYGDIGLDYIKQILSTFKFLNKTF